jgi:hypothetical protein
MEAGSAPELLDALNRKIATLRTEESQLAERAGEASSSSSKAGSFMAALSRNRSGGNK